MGTYSFAVCEFWELKLSRRLLALCPFFAWSVLDGTDSELSILIKEAADLVISILIKR